MAKSYVVGYGLLIDEIPISHLSSDETLDYVKTNKNIFIYLKKYSQKLDSKNKEIYKRHTDNGFYSKQDLKKFNVSDDLFKITEEDKLLFIKELNEMVEYEIYIEKMWKHTDIVQKLENIKIDPTKIGYYIVQYRVSGDFMMRKYVFEQMLPIK